MTATEVKNLITDEGLTITDVIDAVIGLNGITGVGLITLQEQIEAYIKEKRSHSKVSAEAWLNS